MHHMTSFICEGKVILDTTDRFLKHFMARLLPKCVYFYYLILEMLNNNNNYNDNDITLSYSKLRTPQGASQSLNTKEQDYNNYNKS